MTIIKHGQEKTGNSVADYRWYIERCDNCEGTGEIVNEDDTYEVCKKCEGKGNIEIWG